MKKRLFLPINAINSNLHITQKIISGLGKSTKRGIKKCYNCGVYNGTRSTMCKNKDCGIILKDSEEKSRINLDAVKLLTGTEKQVYSVRVGDMGPDYRGFVQLPLLQTHSDKDPNIFSEVALCFVGSCQNSFDNSILKCHEEDQIDNHLFCVHIKSALKSQSTASLLKFKDSTLHSLRISDDIKNKLFLIAREKEGYFVQQVSKSVMAVKCQVSPKHPLGYLHFTFIRGKGKDIYEKCFCSCEEYLASLEIRDKITSTTCKCIHYYACVWALASDTKYYVEFSYFIQQEGQPPENESVINLLPLEKLAVAKATTPISKNKNKSEKLKKYVLNTKSYVKEVSDISKKPRRKEMIRKCHKIMPKILPIEIKVLGDVTLNTSEDTSWKFLDWLSYVTESINKTMKFENCGILNTLVFQIPETLFNCLVKRIPDGYEAIKNGVSVTYHIMNILHLKNIFDTSLIKLIISKKFVHIEQQGYTEYDENVYDSDNYQSSFIFFLNVGQSTVDESDNTNNSFAIEWTAVTSSVTKIGELKLYYKYGRKSTNKISGVYFQFENV